MDLIRQATSLVGVFLVVAAAVYLIGAFVIGAIRDRKRQFERTYMPPSDIPDSSLFQ